MCTGPILIHPSVPSSPDAGHQEPASGGPLRTPEEAQTAHQLLPADEAAVLSNAQLAHEGVNDSALRLSLGVDLGDSRTGVAASFRGFAPRPLDVLTTSGHQLAVQLLTLAAEEGANEFVVGLPLSAQNKQTLQSVKCRAFASLLASHAASRGWKVFLYNEYNTSQDAMAYMLKMGSNRRARAKQLDSHAAGMLLKVYYQAGGEGAELVLPLRPQHQSASVSDHKVQET
eukprot:SM000034S12663  [mRNA]  locus=s34:51813:53391:- [translate_table: standard]